MGVSDGVGARGEGICQLKLTRFVGDAPLFQAAFLGDKFPRADVLVEVVAPTPRGRRAYFFAQVKTSRRGYTDNGRLKIGAAREDLAALAMYPGPRYLLGVDEPGERAYIVAVQGDHGGASSLSTAHELTPETLVSLRDEVQAFWDSLSLTAWRSRFQEPNWEPDP